MKPFKEFTEEKKKGTHGKACWTGYRRKGVNDCVKIEEGTSYSKPDEHTSVMSYHDLEAHIGKPKALLVAKHEQFQKHISPQMSLGAQVGFKFERRHGFESVYAVHGPNKYVDKEKPGYRTMLRFHLSGSGKKVTQVDRSVNHNNERHHEGSLVWNHRETWEHPVNKRENAAIQKRTGKIDEGTTTHTTLSAVKSILPAGHVHTEEESNNSSKLKHNDIIVSRNAKHKEHARFRATSDTGGGDISLASYTSREPEHVAIAAHEAHHALIHHKLKGQGALHSNEHIVNKMTRKWIDKHYVGNDRARAHAAVSKSAASYKDILPTQKMQVHRSERTMAENFADGRNPEDKGDMARHGLKGKSISQLKSIRSSDKSTPRQKQLAHWYINMHSKD